MFFILHSNPDTMGGGSHYNFCTTARSIHEAQDWIDERKKKEGGPWAPHYIITKMVG